MIRRLVPASLGVGAAAVLYTNSNTFQAHCSEGDRERKSIYDPPVTTSPVATTAEKAEFNNPLEPGIKTLRVGITSALRGIQDSAIAPAKAAIGSASAQVNGFCIEKLGIDLRSVSLKEDRRLLIPVGVFGTSLLFIPRLPIGWGKKLLLIPGLTGASAGYMYRADIKAAGTAKWETIDLPKLPTLGDGDGAKSVADAWQRARDTLATSVEAMKSKLGMNKNKPSIGESSPDTAAAADNSTPSANVKDELASGDFGQSDKADRDTYPSRRS
eukprot:m.151182 g.151182  ORF g.151182 m.151182 type:complete len:271 (-) comp17854_c0_seq3:356-1168(-)